MTHILLVEDNPTDRRLVAIALSESVDFEHTLVEADTLAGAMDRMKEGDIDVMLLDLNLPDSAGLETLTTVVDAHPEVPVILLTGLADEELAVQAIRAGAQDFLVKGRMFGELLRRSVRYSKERHAILSELKAKQ